MIDMLRFARVLIETGVTALISNVFGFNYKETRRGNLKYSGEIIPSEGKYHVRFLCCVVNFNLESHLANEAMA
jgi:hypothetical protein